MVGEETSYERANRRDARFIELEHAVTATNRMTLPDAAAHNRGTDRLPGA